MLNKLVLTDENGLEHEVEIITTFPNEDGTKKYVLFTDPNADDDNVYAYRYDDEGNLDEITDEEQEMCEEVLDVIMNSEELNG